MKNPKNKRATIMALILLGLLIIAYKTIFMSGPGNIAATDTAAANASSNTEAENILMEIGGTNFDTSIIENQSFKSLKSIEIPLLSLPVGRKNPFSIVGSN